MSATIKTSGSLRRRLMVQLVGSVAVLAAILFLLVQSFARQVAEESQDNILAASLASILDSVSVQDGAVLVDIPYAALSMLGNVSEDSVFYQIRADGEILTGYEDLPLAPIPGTDGEFGFQTGTYKRLMVRMVSATRRLSVDNRPVEITGTVAQTRNGQAVTLARISRISAIFGIGFFIIAAVLAILAAQSSVRPLKKLTDAVERRGPKDLRPVASPVPREMAPLVSSLNEFIARLRVSLGRSEDFIAEAAHRVRTPLATVRTQAEVALRRAENPQNRAALKEIIRAIDESSRAAGQLLDHAMVTFRTDHLEREKFEVAALVKDIVNRLRPVAELKDITLAAPSDVAIRVSGDVILIQNAIQNVLENAIKYSPAETSITIDILPSESQVEIRVLDQGAGLPADAEDALTGRFVRGSNVGKTVGSGLGLTIANEVLIAHGGRLHLENRTKGTGACVTLFLPL